MTKIKEQQRGQLSRSVILYFEFIVFGIVSDFEFRASNLS